MGALTSDVLRTANAQHGVISRSQLITLGLAPRRIGRLLESGRIEALHRGVYRLAGSPATRLQQAAAACAVRPDVAVSHQSAGRLWGFRKMGPDDALHVLVGEGRTTAIGSAVVHRCARLDADHVVERPDGIRVTTPVRTLFDLADVVGDQLLSSVVEQARTEGLVSVDDLHAIATLRERGRSGSARFGRLLDDLRPGVVASDLELRFERALRSVGLPPPLRQPPIRTADGQLVHPDFFWPEARVAVEVDHHHWHSDRGSTAYDKRRDRAFARVGILVLRVTDDDIEARVHPTALEVRDVVTSRLPAAPDPGGAAA